MGRDMCVPVPAATYVALLRGINVGRARPVAMDALREIVASLGHSDVRTFLRSGNIVFRGPRRDAGDVAAGLERSLATELGMSIGVVVRTVRELAAVVAANPIPEAAGDRTHLHVTFLSDPLRDSERALLATEQFLPDVVRCADREVYIWYRHGMSGSKTAQQLDRRLKTLATDRNWNTVTRLLAMASEDKTPAAPSAAHQEVAR